MAKGARKNLGLLAGLVALGAAGWWSLRGGADHGDGAAAPRAERAGEEARPEAAIVPPAATVGEPERVAVVVKVPEGAGQDLAPAVTAAPPVARAVRPADVKVSGTIVATDPEGVEHPYESGSMNLVLWRADSGMSRPVEVSAGRWSAVVSEDVMLGFTDIALGGRRSVSMEEERIPLPTSRFLAVRARWPRESTLRVRSAETHQDLTGIELVGGLGWTESRYEHPGSDPADALVADAASPIELGTLVAGRGYSGQGILFARAPGYAWGRVEVDFDGGGERFVDLVPGGALRVVLVGTVPWDASLRLRRSGSSMPILELDAGGKNELELTSLVPGPCSASVEMGDWFQEPVELGSGAVEIRAGALARVEIKVAAPPRVQKARLRGVLALDPAWGAIAPELTVQSIGTPADGRRIREHFSTGSLKSVAGAVNTWTFDAGQAPLGDYEFQIEPPFCLLARTLAADTGDMRLEVPAPAVALVRVVDGYGAEVPELTTLHWSPARPQGVMGGLLQSAARDPSTGLFEIRTPSGGVQVSARDAGIQGSQMYELGPGRHAVDLTVTRAVGFTLALRDGSAPLPWPDHWFVKAKEVGGEGRSHGWSRDAQGVRIAVTGPGRYRFSLPAIDGYEPIHEQEVLVPEQGFAEHVVQLVRSP